MQSVQVQNSTIYGSFFQFYECLELYNYRFTISLYYIYALLKITIMQHASYFHQYKICLCKRKKLQYLNCNPNKSDRCTNKSDMINEFCKIYLKTTIACVLCFLSNMILFSCLLKFKETLFK